jgi:hypothetical protein
VDVEATICWEHIDVRGMLTNQLAGRKGLGAGRVAYKPSDHQMCLGQEVPLGKDIVRKFDRLGLYESARAEMTIGASKKIDHFNSLVHRASSSH